MSSQNRHHPIHGKGVTARQGVPAGERIGTEVDQFPFQVHPVYSGVVLGKPWWSPTSKFVYFEFGFVIKGTTKANVIKIICFEKQATEAMAFFQEGTRLTIKFSLSSYATASYYGVRGVLLEYVILGEDKPFSSWISSQLKESHTDLIKKK